MGRVDEVLVLDVSLIPSNPALDEHEMSSVIKETFIKRIIELDNKFSYEKFKSSEIFKGVSERTTRNAWFLTCKDNDLLDQNELGTMSKTFGTLYGSNGFQLVQDIKEYLIDNEGAK